LPVLGIALLISAVALFNGHTLVVEEVELEGFGTELNIVQLSDIHVGSVRGDGYLKRIVEKVNKLEPDAVVITGDLFDGSAPLHDDMIDPLNDIVAPVYFISGNHEMYEGIDEIRRIISNTKLHDLDDKVVEIKGVQLIGVGFEQQKNNLNGNIPSFDKDKPAILLHHIPEGVDYAKSTGIDLMLTGHTHNGQIVPFNLLVKMIFSRSEGLYDVDGMKLYVSPGTGTWGPPMRLGSMNEITLLHLI